MLHADVEREAHGPGRRQRRGPCTASTPTGLVEHALDAGDALLSVLTVPMHVAGERAQRIGALELVAEGEAGQAEIVHGLRLRGG